MRVLVTGGTGSVGINIVRRLARDGHDVVCMARGGEAPDALRDEFLRDVRDRVTLVAGDVSRADTLQRVWELYAPSDVVHAAAITPDRDMEARMARTIVDVNLMGTVNVLDTAHRGGARRVVYISSAAVYGDTPEALAIPEAAPIRPAGLYALTKDASEKLCAYYREQHHLPTTALRVGWVYGPMERPMRGSRHNMSVVHHCVRLALRGEEIRLAHVDAVRDWILADDLAGAVAALLDRAETTYRVYNGAGERGVSHREVLETLGRIVPLHYRETRDPADANVPPLLTRHRRGPLDIRRLLDETSYRPRAGLEEGLRATVEWHRAAGAALERIEP
jgi:nucleoside-diphosphate-sugar epimerase